MQAPLSNPIVLIDSECIFCNYWGNFILKYDKSKRILITVPNSSVGREIMNENQNIADIEKTILFKKEDLIITEKVFKIHQGINDQEVQVVPKIQKKVGFFERFFQLFS